MSTSVAICMSDVSYISSRTKMFRSSISLCEFLQLQELNFLLRNINTVVKSTKDEKRQKLFSGSNSLLSPRETLLGQHQLGSYNKGVSQLTKRTKKGGSQFECGYEVGNCGTAGKNPGRLFSKSYLPRVHAISSIQAL